MNAEQLRKARSYFPYLQNEGIYFNHASTAPISTLVKETIENLLKEKSEKKIDDYLIFKAITDETKKRLGRLINCSYDRIAFLENTNAGLNVLALGLDWKAGDRIILNDVEFPANIYPFLHLKNRRVEIDFVKSRNGIVTAEEIIKKINQKTRLISVSFVQFLSGYKIDLKLLGEICSERGIIFCVDSIQGLGAVKLDVEECKIDFLSNGTQKWLLSLQGLGFIYVRKELQEQLKNAPIGWLAVETAWELLNYDLTLKQTAERFQPSTLNTFGIYAFNAALKIFEEFGIDEIEKQILGNSVYFINKLNEIGYESPLFLLPENNLSGIVSIKNNKVEKLFNHLSEKKIVCSLREGYLRFSPHFYNTKDEIDVVVDEMKNI
jgi:selenocysteine lyase/cysteine desulfurase